MMGRFKMENSTNKIQEKGNSHFLRKFCRQKGAVFGLFMVCLILLISAFAPIIAPNDPLKVDITCKFLKAGTRFWLGTDNLGRCIASRLIWGTRNSLFYCFTVLGITMMIGIPFGLIAGYVGGKVDTVMMRIIDIALALPSFILALAIAGTLGASIENIIFAMSLVWWSGYARFVRGLTIQVKEQDYIQAAKAAGCTHRKILVNHILRNILAPIIVLATLEVGSIILSIAGFSFIGLGVQPPAPEWGIMLSDSKEFIQTQPQLMYYPGIAIVITVMSFNLLGEGIKNAIETD